MKKIVFLMISVLAACASAFADTAKTPELLKQWDKFGDINLFEAKSIYSNPRANADLLKEYAKNPASFKNSDLFPVAICYITFKDFPKALQTLQKLSAARPKDISVYRTLGSVYFLTRDIKNSVAAYKKAMDLGDGFSSVYCASALMLEKRYGEVAALVPALKEFAPKNLEAMNVLLSYAVQAKNPAADKAVKEAFKNADARTLMLSSTPQGFGLSLGVYRARPDLWPTPMLVIPARAAALFEQWPVALDLYQKVLYVEPDNTIALRGMGLVQYRLGDVSSAAKYVKKAFDKGDKDAVVDGIELFLLSKYSFIWDMFKQSVDFKTLPLPVRVGLVRYAAEHSGYADMFFECLADKGAQPLFNEKKMEAVIKQGLDRYSSDQRAKDVAAALYKATVK